MTAYKPIKNHACAVLVLALVATGSQSVATQGASRNDSNIELTAKAGPLIATVSEPGGTGQQVALSRTGWLGGLAMNVGGARRVGFVLDGTFGRASIAELLGSQTVPIEYRFSFVDAAVLASVRLTSTQQSKYRVFVAGGLGISSRFNLRVTQEPRVTSGESVRNVSTIVIGGIDVNRIAVEARYSQDLDGFEPSPVTTPTGTKRLRSLGVIFGYRIW